MLQVHGEVTGATSTSSIARASSSSAMLAPLVAAPPETARRVRAHHHPRRRRVRALGARGRRRDDHAPAPAAQPQRHVRRWHSPALLLPADPQARAGSRGAARGRDQRQSALLPRHRQRAACAATPRNTPAAAPACSRRTAAHRAVRRAFDAGGPTRPARGIRKLPRRGLLRTAAQPRTQSCSSAGTGPCRPAYPFGAGEIVPMRAGETIDWQLLARPVTRMNAAIAPPCATASAASCPWSSTWKPADSIARPMRCSKSPRS